MTEFLTWDPLNSPVDQCTIAGYLTPGLCEVTGASSLRKWEEQAGYAMAGAIVFYRGVALSHFTMTFRLFTEQHWQQWADIRPILMRKPKVGATTLALDVDHPVLNEVGISQMVIEEIAAPEQTEDGVWTIELKCIEWRRYTLAAAKADGAEATPVDPLQVEIGELSSEIQLTKAAVDKGNE